MLIIKKKYSKHIFNEKSWPLIDCQIWTSLFSKELFIKTLKLFLDKPQENRSFRNQHQLKESLIFCHCKKKLTKSFWAANFFNNLSMFEILHCRRGMPMILVKRITRHFLLGLDNKIGTLFTKMVMIARSKCWHSFSFCGLGSNQTNFGEFNPLEFCNNKCAVLASSSKLKILHLIWGWSKWILAWKRFQNYSKKIFRNVKMSMWVYHCKMNKTF